MNTTPKDRPTRRQVDARRAQRDQAEDNRTWRARCVAAAEKAREKIRKEREAKNAKRAEVEPPRPEPRFIVQHAGEPRASRRRRQLDRGKVLDPRTKRLRWTEITPATNVPHVNPARQSKRTGASL